MSAPTQGPSDISTGAVSNTARPTDASLLLPCDVVMAGGVTSGIVYPGAIAELANHYSFQSIGGTSVGAIMAAATAAAEYGRRTGANGASFETLGGLAGELAKTAQGHSRLYHLFAPEKGQRGKSETKPDTRPLMQIVRIALEFLTERRNAADAQAKLQSLAPKVVVEGLAQRARPWLLGAVAAARALWVSWWARIAITSGAAIVALTVAAVADRPLLVIAALLMGGLAIAAAGAIAFAGETYCQWLPQWRANGFGICSGMTDPGVGGFRGLTNWVHDTVQALAGRPSHELPLTFGELWTAGRSSTAQTQSGERAIHLEMITSDISRNRLLTLPFAESVSPLYVDKALLRSFFPPCIAEHMITHAQPPDPRLSADDTVCRLPLAEDMPILFAARLSLSFPFLLSAIKLQEAHYWKVEENGKVVEKVGLRDIYLSDGGITSNFPIQFFDAPLPRWPTFCFNLVDYVKSLGDAANNVNADVPHPVSRGFAANDRNRTRRGEKRSAARETVDWDKIEMGKATGSGPIVHRPLGDATSIGAFAKALVDTARYYGDYNLMSAPGVRERIVHIALDKEEGGLNFDMPKDMITALSQRGATAASVIRAHYDPRATANPRTRAPLDRSERYFPLHRWARYRNVMAALEQLHLRYASARRASEAMANDRGEPSLPDFLAGAVQSAPYALGKVGAAHVARLDQRIQGLAADIEQARTSDPQAAADQPRGDGRLARYGAARPSVRYVLRPLPSRDPRAEIAPAGKAAPSA